MSRLFWTFCLLVLCYFAYQKWTEAPPAPVPAPAPAPVPAPAPAPAPAPVPAPVDFAIKVKVRGLFEEWKRRQLTLPRAQRGVLINPVQELRDIRATLFREGNHSAASVKDVVVRSLREIGIPEAQITEVSSGIMSMR